MPPSRVHFQRRFSSRLSCTGEGLFFVVEKLDATDVTAESLAQFTATKARLHDLIAYG